MFLKKKRVKIVCYSITSIEFSTVKCNYYLRCLLDCFFLNNWKGLVGYTCLRLSTDFQQILKISSRRVHFYTLYHLLKILSRVQLHRVGRDIKISVQITVQIFYRNCRQQCFICKTIQSASFGEIGKHCFYTKLRENVKGTVQRSVQSNVPSFAISSSHILVSSSIS